MDTTKLIPYSLLLAQVHAFTALYHRQTAQNAQDLIELYLILSVNYAVISSIVARSALKMNACYAKQIIFF